MFKIIWDKENNGVLLTMKSNDEALKVPPRPVFFEELDLLGVDKHWNYPKCKEPLLWACDRRYFYQGELVLEARGGNIYDDPQLVFTDAGKKLKLEPINLDELCKKNETTMFLLEHEALEFINTIYRRYRPNAAQKDVNEAVDFQVLAETQEKKTKEKYTVVKEDCDSFDIMPLSEAEQKGKQIILNTKIEMLIASFSGGKDSQVVLDLVSRVIPSDDFLVIYSDTGYEIPPSLEIYEQTKQFYQEQYPNLQFYISKNHQDVLYYWDKMGSPSRIHRWCCSVMKSAPLSRQIKEISGKGKQPNAILFDGVRAEESVNRANRARIGKNVKHNNIINVSPLLYWNPTEIYLYLFWHKLPINQAYKNGLTRVGCVLCPYSSGWSEDLCGKLYPNTISPFIGKIKDNLVKQNISGVDNYIKLGNWKMRAGGRSIEGNSNVNIISTNPDFKAILYNPKVDFFIWLKVLGKYNYKRENNLITGEINYNKKIFKFEVNDSNKNTIIIEFKGVGDEIIFLSHLKKALYKSTYCVHCEVCEVECPTGALSVVDKNDENIVAINDKKCIHCFKCLDFDKKGCITASSIHITNGNKMTVTTTKSGINRYNDGMGLREVWLQKYLNNYEKFFEDTSHGLNPKYQIEPLINWLREAKILQTDKKVISELGKLLVQKYATKPEIVWEIIFVNLCYDSEICKWFHSNIEFGRIYLKSEMEVILQESYPDLKDRTLKNPFNSLLNTFKESPLSKSVSVGVLTQVDKKPALIRQPYNDISPVAVAYSLYRYAESKKRHALTVSELYDSKQTEGIYRQFGVSREEFESILRVLTLENNRVLEANLNMGLDNINLREDLTSMDILKLLL
jgi:3'-phosphoadenosine 5'-phosphosulfate sulfotransferase (PAPS reductase)/FAD synthetase/formate hydrogenlyase subunit 6/NADH:ubiquinone oxidoreductase subunit I